MSLSTGRRLHCYQWTELPVPDYVLDRVEEMATSEKQPVMTNGHPIFEWRPGIPVLDEDGVEGGDREDDDLENGAMYDDDPDDENDSDNEESIHDYQSGDDAADDVVGAVYDTDDDTDTEDGTDESDDDGSDDDRNDGQGDVGVDDVDAGPDAELPAPDAPTTHQRQEPRSDGRPSRSHEATRRRHYAPGFKGKSYEMQLVSVTESKQASWANDCYRIAVDVMFAQMTANKGIKLFGEKAVAAIFKEYNQLNDMMVFGRIDPDELASRQHKRDALRAVNLINEKRCGRVKGGVR
jgi:hypothetical protein